MCNVSVRSPQPHFPRQITHSLIHSLTNSLTHSLTYYCPLIQQCHIIDCVSTPQLHSQFYINTEMSALSVQRMVYCSSRRMITSTRCLYTNTDSCYHPVSCLFISCKISYSNRQRSRKQFTE